MLALQFQCFASSIACLLALASTIEARPLKRNVLPDIPRRWPSGGLSGYNVPLSDGKRCPIRIQIAGIEVSQFLTLHGVCYFN